METYDYKSAILADIEYYFSENIERYKGIDKYELETLLYDDCFVSDSVTGNASGSYYCNSYKAEESLCHNWQLLADAMEYFCCEPKEISNGPEWADVIIRCYLLGECVSEFVNNSIDEEFFE